MRARHMVQSASSGHFPRWPPTQLFCDYNSKTTAPNTLKVVIFVQHADTIWYIKHLHMLIGVEVITNKVGFQSKMAASLSQILHRGLQIHWEHNFNGYLYICWVLGFSYMKIIQTYLFHLAGSVKSKIVACKNCVSWYIRSKPSNSETKRSINFKTRKPINNYENITSNEHLIIFYLSFQLNLLLA